MAHVKIWIHAVWATKERQPLLIDSIRQKIFQHIKENARLKGIHVDIVNGHEDHVHCLFALNAEMTIAKAINLLKGESSHWINKTQLSSTRFQWGDLYFAASVSESMLDKVRQYIQQQEEQHEKLSFDKEYQWILKKYNFEK